VPALELKTELELIERARRGSVDAFEQLVTHYQDRLYRFLLVRANSRADAEDVLQETFVAVFKYLPGYRSEYRFSTWLFTIALRQLGRQRRPLPDAVELPDSLACGQAGPEQHGIALQQQRSIWQTARTCLGESQFTAVWLFYIEDLPVAEIGKIMKRPAGWVKVNLLRARRRLSRELRDQHFEPGISCEEYTL
jgi:RNA polymerase sigma-70 factor (ECF subfamily)